MSRTTNAYLEFVEQQDAKEAIAEFERNMKESRASDLAHSVEVTKQPTDALSNLRKE